jgi:hypothetical protein
MLYSKMFFTVLDEKDNVEDDVITSGEIEALKDLKPVLEVS